MKMKMLICFSVLVLFSSISVAAQPRNRKSSLRFKPGEGSKFSNILSEEAAAIPVDLTQPDISVSVEISGFTGSGTGAVLSAGGDVDGDGLNDLLIGAASGDEAYLVYGSSTVFSSNVLGLAEVASVTFHGQSDGTGLAVSNNGDCNGDGYADMVLGSPFEGVVRVVFGSSYLRSDVYLYALNPDQGINIYSASEALHGDQLGTAVNNDGDFNGDGFADILITTGSTGGPVYLIYGSDSLGDVLLSELQPGLGAGPGFRIYSDSLLAGSVTMAEDVNNDGYSDILISYPTADSNAGRVYLVYGSRGFSDDIDLSVFTADRDSFEPNKGIVIQGGARLGYSVCLSPDINGDSFAEMILVGGDQPTVYVIWGSDDLSNMPDITRMSSSQGIKLTSSYSSASLALSVSAGQDFNADGNPDLLIGVFGPSLETDYASVIYGSTTITDRYYDLGAFSDTEGLLFLGPSGRSFGRVVVLTEDIDGDDHPDLCISASAEAGAVYLVKGSTFSGGENSASGSPQPTTQPSAQPSSHPSVQELAVRGLPSSQPTRQPTSQPTRRPSLQPTSRPTKAFLSGSLKSSLVAFYTFEGNAKDISGNGNDGTIVGGVSSAVDRFGVVNSAYNFDGATGYMYMPGSQFNLQTNLTIAFWVKPAAGQQAWATWVEKTHFGPSGFMDSFTIQQEATVDNAIFFLYAYAAGNVATTRKINIQMVTNAWNHVAITKQGVALKFYLNGVLVDTQTGTTSFILSNGNLPLMIGVSNNGHTLSPSSLGNFFKGVMDEVGFWNRPLNKEEILTLMMNESPTSQPSRQPTTQPTRQPFCPPSSQPSCEPTTRPTRQPLSQPSSQPSREPTTQPTSQPSRQPTTQPTRQPFSAPSSQPSCQPTTRPTRQPSCQPSSRPTVLFLPVSLKSGLVAFYTFAGNAKDSSGNGNDGTLVGGLSLTTDRFGVANNAYNFDGTSGYMVMPGDQFNFENALTVAFWVKPASTQNGWAALVDKSHFANYQGVLSSWVIEQFDAEVNNVFFKYVHYPNVDLPSPVHRTQIVANVWNHVAVTKDGTTLLFYLNGQLVDTQITTDAVIATNGNLPLLIGACNRGRTLPPSGVDVYFRGVMDEVGFWSRALTQSEIRLLMMNESPTSQPSRQPSSQPSRQPSSQPSRQPTSKPTKEPVKYAMSIAISAFATVTPPPANVILEYNGLSADVNEGFGGKYVYISAVTTTEGLNAASTFTFTNPTSPDSRYLDLTQGADSTYYRYLIPSTNYNTALRVEADSLYLFRSTIPVTTFPVGYSATSDINAGRLGDYLYLIYKQVPIPTPEPTSQPTGQPSNQPTRQPSSLPSGQPISQPTAQPSGQPSGRPSSHPSTSRPSVQPTENPSNQPTRQPSSMPSGQPNSQPTTQPSRQPSGRPSSHPSSKSTSQPSVQPTAQPSNLPTSEPTSLSSSRPSIQPIGRPTVQPTGQPSKQPTGQPTNRPSTQPSGQPASRPTSQPSVHPSTRPSVQPSCKLTVQPTFFFLLSFFLPGTVSVSCTPSSSYPGLFC
jgi:hypothetical protein